MTFGYSMEIFRTHPNSKIIHTILLCIFCVVIVIKDRKYFFDKQSVHNFAAGAGFLSGEQDTAFTAVEKRFFGLVLYQPFF